MRTYRSRSGHRSVVTEVRRPRRRSVKLPRRMRRVRPPVPPAVHDQQHDHDACEHERVSRPLSSPWSGLRPNRPSSDHFRLGPGCVQLYIWRAGQWRIACHVLAAEQRTPEPNNCSPSHDFCFNADAFWLAACRRKVRSRSAASPFSRIRQLSFPDPQLLPQHAREHDLTLASDLEHLNCSNKRVITDQTSPGSMTHVPEKRLPQVSLPLLPSLPRPLLPIRRSGGSAGCSRTVLFVLRERYGSVVRLLLCGARPYFVSKSSGKRQERASPDPV